MALSINEVGRRDSIEKVAKNKDQLLSNILVSDQEVRIISDHSIKDNNIYFKEQGFNPLD